MTLYGFQGLQGFGAQAGAQPQQSTGVSVVLFPAERRRFKSRADKALYVVALLARDARVPAWTPRQRDHRVAV